MIKQNNQHTRQILIKRSIYNTIVYRKYIHFVGIYFVNINKEEHVGKFIETETEKDASIPVTRGLISGAIVSNIVIYWQHSTAKKYKTAKQHTCMKMESRDMDFNLRPIALKFDRRAC